MDMTKPCKSDTFTLFGKGILYWVLLLASILGNIVGNSAGLLVGRLYFVHGGSQRWLYTLLQSVGWPMFLPILVIVSRLKAKPHIPDHIDEESHNNDNYSPHHNIHHNDDHHDDAKYNQHGTHPLSTFPNDSTTHSLSTPQDGINNIGHHSSLSIETVQQQNPQKSKLQSIIIRKWPKNYKFTLFLTSSVIGIVLGVDNLLFSWGLSYLPVSTNALLYSTILAFNVLFSYMLLGHKLSAYTVNSTVIIMTGAVLLGLNSSSDRPAGTTHSEYVLGFGANLAASVLYGLVMTLFEQAYKLLELSSEPGKRRSVTMVLQVQVGSQVGAMVVSVLGMWASGTFQMIREEALGFELGVADYVQVLVWSAVSWQIYTIGTLGIVFLCSSLMACVLITATLPLVPILAVPIFHDSFSSIKMVSTFLSIWGLVSYMYDRYSTSKKPPSL